MDVWSDKIRNQHIRGDIGVALEEGEVREDWLRRLGLLRNKNRLGRLKLLRKCMRKNRWEN